MARGAVDLLIDAIKTDGKAEGDETSRSRHFSSELVERGSVVAPKPD